MSKNTKIQWCDHTFNPWIGCTKVSPGCRNCYAEVSTPSRALGIKWGKGQPRKLTSASNWSEPIKWNTEASLNEDAKGDAFYDNGFSSPIIRPRVFCASLSDWLDDEVDPKWLFELVTLIHKTPNLDWLLLTKRPENFKSRLLAAAAQCTVDPLDITDRIYAWIEGSRIWSNVWIGTTVEDQQRADERIPHLLKIPAKVRFLSVEPLIGEITLRSLSGSVPYKPGYEPTPYTSIDWVIVGGESGHNARPCNVEWIRSIIDQCHAAKVACFVKQLGAVPVSGTGQRWTLTDKKGGDPAEWPTAFDVRQFPKT